MQRISNSRSPIDRAVLSTTDGTRISRIVRPHDLRSIALFSRLAFDHGDVSDSRSPIDRAVLSTCVGDGPSPSRRLFTISNRSRCSLDEGRALFSRRHLTISDRSRCSIDKLLSVASRHRADLTISDRSRCPIDTLAPAMARLAIFSRSRCSLDADSFGPNVSSTYSHDLRSIAMSSRLLVPVHPQACCAGSRSSIDRAVLSNTPKIPSRSPIDRAVLSTSTTLAISDRSRCSLDRFSPGPRSGCRRLTISNRSRCPLDGTPGTPANSAGIGLTISDRSRCSLDSGLTRWREFFRHSRSPIDRAVGLASSTRSRASPHDLRSIALFS
jgi:hypothetical protein